MKLHNLMEYVDTNAAVRIFEKGSFQATEAIVQFNGCPGLEYWDIAISADLLDRDVTKVQACASAMYIMLDDEVEDKAMPLGNPMVSPFKKISDDDLPFPERPF